jgi:hypothetical protein
MSKRIDQFLFKNIVRQCYEIDKAWKEWLYEYSNKSKIERESYILFSSKTRISLSLDISDSDLKEDIENMFIFNIWSDMSDDEQKKWEDEHFRRQLKFREVSDFIRMFS